MQLRPTVARRRRAPAVTGAHHYTPNRALLISSPDVRLVVGS
jgi:hypothetical protein